MGSNSFGTLFKITTWGESHGRAVGVVIDGCPAGLELSDEEVSLFLSRRAPGKTPFTSPRQERDVAEIWSGLFEGRTTGAPLSIIIPNQDADSSQYTSIKNSYRPGHANYTYLEKYGIFDYRGGGRASARETACRTAAGAVASKLLQHFGIRVTAYLKQVGEIEATKIEKGYASPIFCPDPQADEKIQTLLLEVKEKGDSISGVVEFLAEGVPSGFGEPIYNKLEANLAKALLSIPASKSFEIGKSVGASFGSSYNDPFCLEEGRVKPLSNHSGGILGGISTGMPLYGRVGFKPTSSIKQPQRSVTLTGEEILFEMPPTARHDPCVAIRGVVVVEAMVALVLADHLLLNRLSRL